MNRQLESVFHTIPDPIAIIGVNGTVHRVNRAFCERFETSSEEAAGAEAAALIIGPATSGERPAACFSRPPSEAYVEERRDLAAAGVFEVSYHPVDMDDGQGTICILRDVTERDLAEAEREALLRQLEAKNAELERYTYTVSHDLKSPLVTIKGFLGLAEKDALAGDFKRLKSDIARVGGAADKMARLLDELLKLSRIGRMANPPQDVALRTLVEEAAEGVDLEPEGRAVDLRMADDLPVIRGDRVRLLEAFQNLLENAVKYMGDQSEPRIEIATQVGGNEIICSVRDNGIGIAPKFHQRIFGLFDQLDPSRGGTGIGLALVKRIAEAHGGRAWVESDGPERGSSFYVALPRPETDVPEEENPPHAEGRG